MVLPIGKLIGKTIRDLMQHKKVKAKDQITLVGFSLGEALNQQNIMSSLNQSVEHFISFTIQRNKIFSPYHLILPPKKLLHLF